MYVGIDPGTTHIGVAVHDGRMLVHLHGGRYTWPDLLGTLERFQITEMAVELPPTTARADVGPRKQAEIGLALGRVIGRLEQWAFAHDVPVELVEVSTWRESMKVHAARHGLYLHKAEQVRAPGGLKAGLAVVDDVTRPDEGGFLIRYKCGHEAHAGDYEQLVELSQRCAGCARPEEQAGQVRRAAYKAQAYHYADTIYRPEMRRLVEFARGRAKSTKAPQDYAGVSDAAEALGILSHLLIKHGEF